jgi:hypothetical protein
MEGPGRSPGVVSDAIGWVFGGGDGVASGEFEVAGETGEAEAEAGRGRLWGF